MRTPRSRSETILLDVRVRYHGRLIEDRVVRVRDRVVLGDPDGAEVAFPGASLVIRRVEGGFEVRGRRIGAGQVWAISLGPVDVSLESIEPEALPRAGAGLPDLRLLVATAAIALAGAFWDAASTVVGDHPAASRAVAVLRDRVDDEPASQVAAMQVADVDHQVATEALDVPAHTDRERPPAVFLSIPQHEPAPLAIPDYEGCSEETWAVPRCTPGRSIR